MAERWETVSDRSSTVPGHGGVDVENCDKRCTEAELSRFSYVVLLWEVASIGSYKCKALVPGVGKIHKLFVFF